MNEARFPADPDARLWMVGLRFRDISRRFVRHYYLVTAADPGRAVEAGRLRFGSTEDRGPGKDTAPDAAWCPDTAWCEVSEIVIGLHGPRHLRVPCASGGERRAGR